LIRVGLIGAGLMGSTHARILASVAGAELVAISDPDREAAERIGVGRVFDDPHELIAAVDAVIVASPSVTHEAFTLAALELGKRVLCEKPLAPDPEAALRIVEAEAALGRRLITVGFMRRYDPAYVELKSRLDAGVIGRPLLLHCVHRNPNVNPDFSSAKVITDSAVHELDLTRWLLESEIARITVLAPRPTREADPGVLDPQLILLETESGTVVDVEAFANARYGYDIRCEVVGESGTLALAPHSHLVASGANQTAVDVPTGYQERFAAAYQLELQAWVGAIALGDEPPPASAWDGYAAAAVAAAGVRALESGAPAAVGLRGLKSLQ
jgi:myo-inositol 2-dehydrogenase/D-chiro-inositol 1-dehydrogenase